jgi:glycosyltransferase involved in cell wall biosynthesis
MKHKILVKAPVLSQSGYGEQARFALRSLKSREDIFDIYIIPIAWGKTGWISEDNDERRWIDDKIRSTHVYGNSNGKYDISLQITIPNEWENLAPVNIGYTAGIETTKVSPAWLQKANEMDKIIVVSNHSKEIFKSSTYQGQNPHTGQIVNLECNTSIDVVNYPVRSLTREKINLNLEHDFNYLAISQWGPRKNFDNLINWFVEENFDQEVGLVLKTSIKNNSIIDREQTENRLKNILSRHENMKCKVYLLHGDLTPEEMNGLYTDKKIKCLISTTHGEGYGLPLFEAAYNGLPIVVHGWSGQSDFLYIPQKNGKRKPMFASVEYDLQNVQKEAVWENVIQPDSQWAYSREASFKRRLREVKSEYTRFKRNATKLKNHLLNNFTEEAMYSKFVENIIPQEDVEFLQEIEDMFEDLNV